MEGMDEPQCSELEACDIPTRAIPTLAIPTLAMDMSFTHF
jgi:hypothetical protein